MVVSQTITVHKEHSQRIGIYRLVTIHLNQPITNSIDSNLAKNSNYQLPEGYDKNKKTINLQLLDRVYPCTIKKNVKNQNRSTNPN